MRRYKTNWSAGSLGVAGLIIITQTGKKINGSSRGSVSYDVVNFNYRARTSRSPAVADEYTQTDIAP
ncbi:hypothetical protein EVAR_86536_1 [Eumeta japonica]|uniref:Uncharacterized protein n=1 Tax=Eumeta variegata TaxID=151549 RepID=A0A4C1VQC0_EUMVA|nr:hypothetical protein EVAR_86536_1 [Eumeta japonica]